MRRLLSFISASVILVYTLAPAMAQRSDFNAMHTRVQELFAGGNYTAALVEAQKFEAAAKAQLGTNHTNYALALNDLALIYRVQGSYADAEPLYRRSLTIYEKALGPDH